MNNVEGSSKKMIFKALTLMMLSLVVMCSCYVFHNHYTYESIKVVVADSASIEYGSANYDINKLVKEVNGEIVSVKKDVDPTKVGKQEVVLSVRKENVVKDVPIIVNVIDTKAPVIKLKNEKMTITEGDKYDLNSNINSVVDEVDGNISYLKDINENSKYYYNISYGEDINAVGNHEVLVTAKDKYGNASTMKFTLEVKEKPKPKVEPSTNNGPVYSNLPANAASGDLVSIAYSLVGSPYVSGSNGPYAFDCSGFVQYVYSQVGINVSRSSYTQYYDGVGVSYADAKPGDILSWGHGGRVTHSALYVGDGKMVHATNPSQGVVVSSVEGWQNASIDNLMAVRRVK